MPDSHAPRPVMLVILDGFGWREDETDNAVVLAKKPNFDKLWASYPHTFLEASEEAVGLPHGQFGNSEVGHTTIGAGRVLMQDLPRIGKAVKDGSLAALPALAGFIEKVKKAGGVCHLMGLVSTGGVHAHQDHAAALAKAVCAAGLKLVLHIFTDGRDTAPNSAKDFVQKLIDQLPEGASVGTVSGRYFAMDRDNRWDRVEKAYNAVANAQGDRAADALAAIEAGYQAGKTDEFIPPTVIGDYQGMRDGDGLLSFNYRADRIREILAPFTEDDFSGFNRPEKRQLAAITGMTQYSDALAEKMETLFPPEKPKDVLGEVVSKAGKTQLRTAETEKYPHVTYFMNGGREEPFEGEDRTLVASPKVATYDLQPEMSEPEVTAKAVQSIDSGKYDLIILNYANPDMVGHTGDLQAAIKAVEAVDTGLGKLVEAVRRQGGTMFVTADHGNCEIMRDPQTGEKHTAHTTNLVPAILVDGPKGAALHKGGLADIAPTLLTLMGLDVPQAMTGKPLIDAR